MIERQFTQCMIRPSDLEPMTEHTQVVGTFNPGVAAYNGEVVLLVRVVEQPTQHREGFVASPGFGTGGEFGIDWFETETMDLSDPRKYVSKDTGITRLRFFSYLRLYYSKDGRTIDREGPCVLPDTRYEEYGIEDPRITRIDDTYYITYVGVSRHGVATCLMSTRDFDTFERHGIIFVPENKDVLLFPERIGDQYLAMHRPVPSMRFRPPEMWLARSTDLIHWGGHEQFLGPEMHWGCSRIGGGTPPIRTSRGWLTIYHGSKVVETELEDERGERPVGTYTAGTLLLDLDDPSRIIGSSPEPIMEPTEDFEIGGYVANVVFPTGIIERDDLLYVYYGAADQNTAVTAYKRDDIMRVTR